MKTAVPGPRAIASEKSDAVTPPSSTQSHQSGLARWRLQRLGIRILSALCGLVILSLATAALALLEIGDRGPEVSELQSRLSQEGFYFGPIDGDFGPQTEDAVIQFQQTRGLLVDGIAGEETLSALGLRSVIGFTPAPAPAYVPPTYVPPAQTFSPLPTLPSDPFLAPQPTPAAPFSTAAGVSATATILRPGDRGPAVEELQRRLQSQGFAVGPIDGIYGSQTTEAVRSFQRARGLFPDGIANSTTLTALGITGDQAAPYVVVIPGGTPELLVNIQRRVPGAFIDVRSNRGPFVSAGAFRDRANAERRSQALRSLGFDARVAYFR